MYQLILKYKKGIVGKMYFYIIYYHYNMQNDHIFSIVIIHMQVSYSIKQKCSMFSKMDELIGA